MIDATLHLPASLLHEAFSDRSGVPLNFFELYYRGKRLEGEAALASWGVGKGATIEVKMRGRGGGNCRSVDLSMSVDENPVMDHQNPEQIDRDGQQQQATQEEPSSSEAAESQSAKGLKHGLEAHGLEAHDFTTLWHEKLEAHLAGTREWAFTEIFAWLDAAPSDAAAQLFWLMGGGGVGKSVLTAELLRRAHASNRVVAWHFCRHDNPQQSSPDVLLRSLAAMLCARLPGYKEALGEVSAELLKATDPKELFAALFTAPLLKVKSPETPSLIILDALDELPKQGQKPLLSVITAQLSTLPPWLRLFVTSREEPQIKAALAKFKRKELRADEAKNRADVEVRWLATCNVTCLAKIRTIRTMAYRPCRTMAIQNYTHYGYTDLTVTMTGLSMTITDYD